MTITTINPATNKTLKTFEPLTKDEIIDAVENADKAYLVWKKTSFEKRKAVLLKFAQQLRNRSDTCTRLQRRGHDHHDLRHDSVE